MTNELLIDILISKQTETLNQPITAHTVAMIKPLTFTSNSETANTNFFQKSTSLSAQEILERAQFEFTQFQLLLLENKIKVFAETEENRAQTPDALFLNNWFCHLPQVGFFIFPMQALNRRREVRLSLIKKYNQNLNLPIIDLRYLENTDAFLEGTGSLIFDHQHKIGYAAISSRTSFNALKVFEEKSGYKVISFNAVDNQNKPIYHTNVMMALGADQVIINLDSIKSIEEKEMLIQAFEITNKQIIDITQEQMNHFCGNALYLQNLEQEKFWVMSTQAYHNFNEHQIKALQANKTHIIHSPLDTIETIGGGGARCLLAEVF